MRLARLWMNWHEFVAKDIWRSVCRRISLGREGGGSRPTRAGVPRWLAGSARTSRWGQARLRAVSSDVGLRARAGRLLEAVLDAVVCGVRRERQVFLGMVGAPLPEPLHRPRDPLVQRRPRTPLEQ